MVTLAWNFCLLQVSADFLLSLLTLNLATEFGILKNTRIFFLLEIYHEMKRWQFRMFRITRRDSVYASALA